MAAVTSIPILMYHNIAHPPRELKLWRNLYVPPKSFQRQMWLLHRLGYQGLSMSEAMPYLRGEKQGRVAVITFDDGYEDNFTAAMPVLKHFGFSATCYVVSNRIGSFNLWDADTLGVRKQLMNTGQLREWVNSGLEIGAHTRNHLYLTRCEDIQLIDEIHGSKCDLEALLGVSVTQFCYPYGGVDKRVAQAVRQAGYSAATTTHRARAMTTSNIMRLPRVPVYRHYSLLQFGLHVLTRFQDGSPDEGR
jgi:peptidoglycan/xylan/chitin deacetylase (PgdA/CDA1 family)